ncbi:MAG: adenylyl-sulfate kinase [Burkholderiaceae bacterium]
MALFQNQKGSYAKAKNGLIHEFTGDSSPYEAPLAPALLRNTVEESVEESVVKQMAIKISDKDSTQNCQFIVFSAML